MKYIHNTLRKVEKRFLGLQPTKRRWFIFLLLTHFLLAIGIWEVAQVVTYRQIVKELQENQHELRQEIRSIARYAVELEMGYLQNKKLGPQKTANQARY